MIRVAREQQSLGVDKARLRLSYLKSSIGG